MKGKGYSGGKSPLHPLVAPLRPPWQQPLVRIEGLPGEFSQHDSGQVDVRSRDRSKEPMHFFISRLKYSRWSEVRIVPDEEVVTCPPMRPASSSRSPTGPISSAAPSGSPPASR